MRLLGHLLQPILLQHLIVRGDGSSVRTVCPLPCHPRHVTIPVDRAVFDRVGGKVGNPDMTTPRQPMKSTNITIYLNIHFFSNIKYMYFSNISHTNEVSDGSDPILDVLIIDDFFTRCNDRIDIVT